MITAAKFKDLLSPYGGAYAVLWDFKEVGDKSLDKLILAYWWSFYGVSARGHEQDFPHLPKWIESANRIMPNLDTGTTSRYRRIFLTTSNPSEVLEDVRILINVRTQNIRQETEFHLTINHCNKRTIILTVYNFAHCRIMIDYVSGRERQTEQCKSIGDALKKVEEAIND